MKVLIQGLNRLKLNDTKTECVLFYGKGCKPANVEIRMGDSVIKTSSSTRDLGAYLDCHLSMEREVNETIRAAYFHLRRTAKIRSHLTKSASTRAIIATVISRIDYHNGLLAGVPEKLTRRLQLLQNNAARLITQTPSRSHITPVLCSLHWLPVKHKISYKVLLHVHKSLYTISAPVYLKSCVRNYEQSRVLRSQSRNLLCVPKTNKRYGDTAFGSFGPRLWNTLPQNLRTIQNLDVFKKELKTHLFKDFYQV